MSEFVWGIDPPISRLPFAFADTETSAVEVETLITGTEEREGTRLGLLDRQVRIRAQQLAGRHLDRTALRPLPQPAAHLLRRRAPSGPFETLAVPVWTVPSSTWKQRTIGRGNATKPQVRAWVDRLGVNVRDQDEADAVAIALAGRAMLNARSWDAIA